MLSSKLNRNGTTRRTLLKSAGLIVGSSMLMPNMRALAMNSPWATASGSAIPGSTGPRMKADGSPLMPRQMIGFMLSHEQFAVPELIHLGVTAEQAGFDLLATSDHLQPWQANEGHSAEAWVTMAAIGERTKKIWIRSNRDLPIVSLQPSGRGGGVCVVEPAVPGTNLPGSRIGRSAQRASGDGNLAQVVGALRSPGRSVPDHPPDVDGRAGEPQRQVIDFYGSRVVPKLRKHLSQSV